MFMRIVSAKILPDKMDEFRHLYKNEIVAALEITKGCRYAYLSESMKEDNIFFQSRFGIAGKMLKIMKNAVRLRSLSRKLSTHSQP